MQLFPLQVGDCVESVKGGWHGARYHHPDGRHVVVDCAGREGTVQSVNDLPAGQGMSNVCTSTGCKQERKKK